MRLCTKEGCGRKHVGLGFCARHYKEHKRRAAGARQILSYKQGDKCSAENCDRPPRSNGLCKKHNARMKTRGRLEGLRPQAVRGEPESWIKENATYSGDGCLIWPFGSGVDFKVVIFEGKRMRARRAMCLAAHGPQPDGDFKAVSTCNNPACVAPSHVFWGTQQDHIQNLMKTHPDKMKRKPKVPA